MTPQAPLKKKAGWRELTWEMSEPDATDWLGRTASTRSRRSRARRSATRTWTGADRAAGVKLWSKLARSGYITLDRLGTIAVPTKYLLYIDILGFADLVRRDPHQVEKIYGVLDTLNVHRHKVFRTIVFSDTVLVYNRQDPKPTDTAAHEYIVWYSIEFAEDLHHRLIGQGLYFRAVLVS